MNLLHFYFDNNWNLVLLINWLLILPIGLIILGLIVRNMRDIKKIFRGVDIDCAELNIHGQKIKLKPNNVTVSVAYKLWVEINTRKIGQEIDYSNDVIEEVYNSWYEFFKVTRELLKEIPAAKATEKNTKHIIEITTNILNDVIRPHLTRWQARFRHWNSQYDGCNISPQRRQLDFVCPENKEVFNFAELKADMEIVNKTLIDYKKILENIIL